MKNAANVYTLTSKLTQYDEKELFARIAADDAIAFQRLFQQYFQLLRFNALKLLKSDYWAEEVTQETLLHVWEIRHTLKSIEQPAAWLFRVVANKCFNRIKRQDIELRVQYFINKIVYEKKAIEQEGYHDYNLLRNLIKEAVDRLPEQQRLAYILQQEEELSYKQIAQRLNISPNTVRNHLIRAFHAIRSYLATFDELLSSLLLFFFL